MQGVFTYEVKVSDPVGLLYLHGFNSSPDSFKARAMLSRMRALGLDSRLCIPQIPHDPADAAQLLRNTVEAMAAKGGVALVGSSLGGFYATWLAEHCGCRAVLINPAVRPYEVLRACLGPNRNYHTFEQWTFTQSHIDALQELECAVTMPERYLVMLQTADETLDYRQALGKYEGCNMWIEAGGSHAYDGFENHLDRILSFCYVHA